MVTDVKKESLDVVDVFRFQFASKSGKSNVVYSLSKEDMSLFLKQHGFDLNNAYVDVIKENLSKINEDLLMTYNFKSNTLANTFTLSTTTNFINDAIITIGSDLSASLMFGLVSIYGDIEIFELISSLIDEVPHVFIIDQYIADESNNYHNYIDNPIADKFYSDGYDDEGIYESLLEASVINNIQPITIEAYVKYFTSLLLL